MSVADRAPPPPSQKFKVDKATSGNVTLLSMRGVLDEGFEGKKVAVMVQTKKLVVDLSDVRRFASWGMSEWMDFLQANAARDIYLVECSAYSVNQINLVTGLLGQAKLVSFYTPYRCSRCENESDKLVLVPRDRAMLASPADEICARCGGRAAMEKYPAAMTAAIASKEPFDIDDEVLAFMRERLKYDLVPDVTRFRAQRRAQNGLIYLRLSGDLTKLQPAALATNTAGTLLVDLAGVTFGDDLNAWRSYVDTVLPKVASLELIACPPRFLDVAVTVEDLSKTKVRTAAIVYPCPSCATSTTVMLDIASNLEQLVEGQFPASQCPTCKLATAPSIARNEAQVLRRLPARSNDAATERFLQASIAEPSHALDDALVAAAESPQRPAGMSKRSLYVALAFGVAIVAGLGVIAALILKQGESKHLQESVAPTGPAANQFQRPDWILADSPSSAFCHDMINRLMCVGVSSYRSTRSEGVDEANDAALEELANTIALKISNPAFKASSLAYVESRNKALAALQSADVDRAGAPYASANSAVRKARHRVVELLQSTGGPAVPAQRTDWYWEEYSKEKGTGTEALVFVRYDVTNEVQQKLVENYSTQVSLPNGSSALTAFPSIAWRDAAFAGGALLASIGKPLAAAGIAPYELVTSVGAQVVVDAPSLAKLWTPPMTLKLGFGAASRTVELKH